MEELTKLTIKELQSILKQRGLSYQYQRKFDLVERLYVATRTLRDNSKNKESVEQQEETISKEVEAVLDRTFSENLDIRDGEGEIEVSEKDLEEIKEKESVGKEESSNLGKGDGEERNIKMAEGNFSFRDIEESLETFDGEKGRDVTSWLRAFNQIATVCKWGDVQKYLYARRLLKGAARLAVEATEGCTSWDDLQTMLRSEFATSTSSIDIHRALEGRRKKQNESFLEYTYAMKQLGSRGGFDEETIVAYIIQGIPDDPANKMMLYEATTIGELKTKLKAYEMMRSQKVARPSTSGKQTLKPNIPRRSEQERRCFSCGSFSHISFDCPERNKGVRCFRCNGFGHVAPDCPQKRSLREVKKEVNLVSLNHATVKVTIYNQEFIALVDTGSDVTLVAKSVYDNIMVDPSTEGPGLKLIGLGRGDGRSLRTILLPIQIDEEVYRVRAHVVPDGCMAWSVLVGRDLLQDAILTMSREGVTITRKPLGVEDPVGFMGQTDIVARVGKERSTEDISKDKEEEISKESEGRNEVGNLNLSTEEESEDDNNSAAGDNEKSLKEEKYSDENHEENEGNGTANDKTIEDVSGDEENDDEEEEEGELEEEPLRGDEFKKKRKRHRILERYADHFSSGGSTQGVLVAKRRSQIDDSDCGSDYNLSGGSSAPGGGRKKQPTHQRRREKTPAGKTRRRNSGSKESGTLKKGRGESGKGGPEIVGKKGRGSLSKIGRNRRNKENIESKKDAKGKKKVPGCSDKDNNKSEDESPVQNAAKSNRAVEGKKDESSEDDKNAEGKEKNEEWEREPLAKSAKTNDDDDEINGYAKEILDNENWEENRRYSRRKRKKARQYRVCADSMKPWEDFV